MPVRYDVFGASVPVSYDKDIYGEGLELIKQLRWEKLSGQLCVHTGYPRGNKRE